MGAGFFYELEQSGKVAERAKKRRDPPEEASGFIDGFLEAGEALIELKQFNN